MACFYLPDSVIDFSIFLHTILDSVFFRWFNDANQILNNWALLCIDMMNRGLFLIQFSFFLAASAKKKKVV